MKVWLGYLFLALAKEHSFGGPADEEKRIFESGCIPSVFG